MKGCSVKIPIPLIVIGLALFFLQRNYMDEYPKNIHAWAEQDHYALALGFLNNGFDLFHPETMIYNKQFPDWWKTASESTVTAVDFPIHEYCAALLMKLFGTTSPWVFRLWTLLWGLIGLLYLYRVAFLITNSISKSLFVSFLALCSPVFIFYSNGFLPSVPALALGIIGLWHYLLFIGEGKRKQFHLSIVFLTLAMLIRTTFAIELIAILCFELLRIFRKESTLVDKLPAVLLSAAAFIGYYLWNRHLREMYGSIFLSQLVPPEDLQDAKELIADTYHQWTFHYFQRSQYIVFALLIAVAVGYAFRNRKLRGETQPSQTLSLWWLGAIYTFGCLLFSVAMMQQMPYHDYYLLDTYFLPILLMVMLMLKAVETSRLWLKAAFVGVAVILCSQWFHGAKTMQKTRRETEDAALLSYVHFKDADLVLDSLNIPRDAKILCLYGYPQNGPFIQMGRKGYIVMEDDDELLGAAFNWDYDYIVIENAQFVKYFDTRREMLSRLKKIGGNNSFAVCTPTNNWIYKATWQFFYPPKPKEK